MASSDAIISLLQTAEAAAPFPDLGAIGGEDPAMAAFSSMLSGGADDNNGGYAGKPVTSVALDLQRTAHGRAVFAHVGRSCVPPTHSLGFIVSLVGNRATRT